MFTFSFLLILTIFTTVIGNDQCGPSKHFIGVSTNSFIDEGRFYITELIHFSRNENCKLRLAPFRIVYDDINRTLEVKLNEAEPVNTESFICSARAKYQTVLESIKYAYFGLSSIVFKLTNKRLRNIKCYGNVCSNYPYSDDHLVFELINSTVNLRLHPYCEAYSTYSDIDYFYKDFQWNLTSHQDSRMSNLTQIIPIFMSQFFYKRTVLVLYFEDKLEFGYVDARLLCKSYNETLNNTIVTFDDLFVHMTTFQLKDFDKIYRDCEKPEIE